MGFDPEFSLKLGARGWIGMVWPKAYGGHERTALEREFARRGLDPQIPPGVVTVLMASVGRILVLEQAIGMSGAHEETRALVEATLRQYETTGEALPAVAKALPR